MPRSDHVPALGQRRHVPGGIRTPVLPAGRPRWIGEHLRRLVPDVVLVEIAAARRFDQLVFVLPAHGTVGRHDEVELLVDEVDPDRRASLVALEVDVPVREAPLAPLVPQRPPCAETDETEALADAVLAL